MPLFMLLSGESVGLCARGDACEVFVSWHKKVMLVV